MTDEELASYIWPEHPWLKLMEGMPMHIRADLNPVPVRAELMSPQELRSFAAARRQRKRARKQD